MTPLGKVHGHNLFRSYSSISGVLLLLSLAPAAAQDRCTPTPPPGLASDSLLAEFGPGDPDVVEFLTGEIEASFGDEPTASLTGGVLLRRGDRFAGADTARYDPVDPRTDADRRGAL